MSQTDGPPQRREFRDDVDGDIRRAVIFLLSERGYAGVTMLAIAKQAGLSVETLSERYAHRDAVVIGVLHRHAPVEPLIVDTGDLAVDIRTCLGLLSDRLRQPQRTRLIATLMEEATHNPAIAAALQNGLAAPVRADLRAVFERAIARGAMRPGIDLDVVIDLAAGPLYLRQIESFRPADENFLNQLADLVFTAIKNEQ